MRISTNQIYFRGLDNMLNQQVQVSKYQDQLSSGKKVQSPSDDPIAAAKISLMKQRISSSEQFQKNKDGAQSAISLEERTLSNAVSVLQRVRELQVQAGNGALSEDDRHAMGIETQALLGQLFDLANSQDSNGNFMFSGSKGATQAFMRNSNGQYFYNGDDTQRFQTVSEGIDIAISDTGSDLFMRIPNGNGTFTVTQTATPNTGSAAVTSGSLVDSAAYVADNYTLQFVLNSSNQLVYMISGVASGAVVPSTGNPDDAPIYQDGVAINFNGMEVTVSGNPNPGDAFNIDPASNESIFSTINRMVVNLNKLFSNPSEKAAVLTENNQILDQLDSGISNLLNYQAQTGARLNQLQIVEQVNGDLIDTSTDTLSGLENADLTDTAVKLNLQLIYLQAAQQSFARIQGLSAFNYL